MQLNVPGRLLPIAEHSMSSLKTLAGNRTLLQIRGPSSKLHIPVVAKGPESAEQCRLHSLGIQRDRKLSMRAHTLQKEPERTTIQLTAEEHNRQEYMTKHSSATARNQHFQNNPPLKF